MAKNNARMTDPSLLVQAGMNPKTGLPTKFEGVTDSDYGLKDAYLKCFRIKDEQDAINRYIWYNLPYGLDSRLIERILYYRGQGAFFKLGNKFYFLPYTLESPDDGPGIDMYGRYRGITPLPFNGSGYTDEGKKKEEKPWIQGLMKKPIYDFLSDEEILDESFDIEDFIENSCVLIKDYSDQLPPKNIPRQMLQDPLLQYMSEIPCFARSALLNSTGVMGVIVQNENEAAEVYAASEGVTNAAITGRKYIPLVGAVDFQELSGNSIGKAEEFLVSLESLDNLRLGFYGIPNGGVFQKKAHMLESEQQMNAGAADLALLDGLKCRQDAIDLINFTWGLGIACEINPALLGTQMLVGDFSGNGEPDAVESQNTNTSSTGDMNNEE